MCTAAEQTQLESHPSLFRGSELLIRVQNELRQPSWCNRCVDVDWDGDLNLKCYVILRQDRYAFTSMLQIQCRQQLGTDCDINFEHNV